MLPTQLNAEEFKGYPPKAKQLAIGSIPLLRQLPTIYVASLLREVIRYDWKFPAERTQVDRQLAYLASLNSEQLQSIFAGFSHIRLDRKLEDVDWVRDPMLFSERLTAYLWSTHQIDAFRTAAMEFESRIEQARPPQSPPITRLGIVVIGQGVEKSEFPLFTMLRPHGVHFTQVNPENGLQILLDAAAARAAAHPIPYGHWYIEGSTAIAARPGVTTVAYNSLEPVRRRLLQRIERVIQSGIGGPEMLEVAMANLRPDELGLPDDGRDEVLKHFEVNVFTEGAGTQIYSTTFVMWAAREAIRRAEPVTLLARFTPRQQHRPMNELLSAGLKGVQLDPEGSLRDADIAAYYTWLDQQHLTGADEASFLVWFEGHNEALAVAPGLPRGTESNSVGNLRDVLGWLA